MIVVKNMTVGFGEKIVLSDISFHVNNYDCIGLIGVNGAGKTTLFKVLMGLIKPNCGFISVNETSSVVTNKQILSQIGFVSGTQSALWSEMKLKYSFSHCAEMYHIPKKEYIMRLNFLCKIFDMEKALEQTVQNLSVGQRMKGDIIYALLPQPKLLLLDEPTIGLDLNAKEALIGYLHELHKTNKTTIIFSGHSLREVERLCSRLLLLQNTKLLYDGTLEDFTNIYASSCRLKLRFDGVIPDFEDMPLTRYYLEKDNLCIDFDKNKITAAEIMRSLSKQTTVLDMTLYEPDLEDIVKKLYIKEEF